MKSLFGFLPFLGTFLWMTVHATGSSAGVRSWRWALALSCVLLATFSLVLTELLSATHLLSWGPVFTAWSLFALLPAGILAVRRNQLDLAEEWARLLCYFKSCPIWAGCLLAGTGTLVLIMAVATPPMNFDVQIYHMPRQIFWLMQGSVEPFEAAHSHQISMPVLSEFIGLNLLILSGGDHWHNLVQSLFLLAACGLVSLCAACAGGSKRAEWLGVLFAVLVPVVFF